VRKPLVQFSVALFTFTLGACATTLWLGRFERLANDRAMGEARNMAVAADPLPMFYSPTYCTLRIGEAPEEKAVRLAEEFVARNGYTELPSDRMNLSYESIEWESDVDEMLKQRHDTLERSAYGMRYAGRTGGSGWAVAFEYKKHYCDACDKVGRAVTMDAKFNNLRVEHTDIFLKAVDKKL